VLIFCINIADVEEVKFGVSERHKVIAYYDCRFFYFHIQNADKPKKWRCANYLRQVKCKAMLKTKEGKFISSNDHSCPIVIFQLDRKQFRESLSQAANSTSESTARVVATKLMQTHEAVVPLLPQVRSMKHVQRNQKKVCGNIKPQTSLDNLEIPAEIIMARNDKPFILYDSKEATGLYIPVSDG